MKLENSKFGYIEGIASIIVNLILFGLKMWVGILVGSVALIADAWHTLSDSLTSGVVIVGVWISKKPADKKHPFGHGRAELISAIIISILLALVGINFIFDSINQLVDKVNVNYSTLAIVITTISIIAKEGLARFSIWAGKKTGLKSLIADGWHHRSDALTSVIILIGIFLSPYFWWIDGVLGLIVSLFIFKVAYDVFKDTSTLLIGEKPDSELIEKIKETIKEITGDTLDFHHEHYHRYGEHIEISFHLCLPGELTLDESHNIVDKIEKEIKFKYNVDATIHAEPKEIK
ncbi:MAG: cation transporter [Ignavibacteriales bacterium]|nr:cation transporter [Ignavibacteriales bacterium]